MPHKKTLKRKVKKIKKKKSSAGKKLLFLVLTGLLLVVIYFLYAEKSNKSRIASEGKDSLQIGFFIPETPHPTSPAPLTPPEKPTIACNHDNGQPAQVNDGKPVSNPSCFCPAFLVECKDRKCVSFILSGKIVSNGCDFGPPDLNPRLLDQYCMSDDLAPTDGTFCIGKPVIYLYPEKPIFVDVSVETDGEIFISDPPYPEGGWKNVLAEPGGKLTYQGENYRELFYESNVKDIRKPARGLSIDSKNIRAELDNIITKLGLINEEKTEFLDYWVPRLKTLNSPYVFFSIIESDEKNRIDKVLIEPKPDTMIEFIAYFSPLDEPFEGKPLELPTSAPKRIGFTVVEWGGTIGR